MSSGLPPKSTAPSTTPPKVAAPSVPPTNPPVNVVVQQERNGFWRWPIEMFFIGITAIATCVSGYTSYQAIQLTNKTIKEQDKFSEEVKNLFKELNHNTSEVHKSIKTTTEVLDKSRTEFESIFGRMKDVLNESSNSIQKIFFQWAIDQASINCPSCYNCSNCYDCILNPTMRRYLEVAAKIETKIKGELSAADYNTLAAMGSNYWDYIKLKYYCDQALLLSSPREKDKFYTFLILGYLNYRDYNVDLKSDIPNPSIKDAHNYFDAAIKELESLPDTDQNIYERCYAYTLREAWEIIRSKDISQPIYSINEGPNKYEKQKNDYIKELKRRNPASGEIVEAYLKNIVKSAELGYHPRIPCFPFAMPTPSAPTLAPDQAPTPELKPIPAPSEIEPAPQIQIPSPAPNERQRPQIKPQPKPQDKRKQQPTPAPQRTRPQSNIKESPIYKFYSNQNGHIPQQPMAPWQRPPY